MKPLSNAPAKRSLSVRICWITISGFVLVSIALQMRAARLASTALLANSGPNPGLEITGRLAVAQSQMLSNDRSESGLKRADNLRNQLLANIQLLALSPLDKLKAAVLLRELRGANAALQQLDADAFSFINHTDLLTCDRLLHQLYSADYPLLSESDRQFLTRQLGWFGRLALTQNLPLANPERIAIINSARHCFVTGIALLVALLVLLAAGFLLLILFIVLFSVGKMRFLFRSAADIEPPIYLESFAIWGVMYLLLSLLLSGWKSGRSPLLFELFFTALTAAVAIWPVARGVSWAQLRQSLGWHTGRGVVREIAAGILGYIAGLPILAVGVLFTLILSRIGHANPTHPIAQELSAGMSLGKIVGLLITISVAAPLLEETMFRGALYTHLRRRWSIWFSAALVAVIFAAIHPQGWAAIPVLGSIAITLALLREWRGSLIASVVAHGINNGVVLLSVVLVLR